MMISPSRVPKVHFIHDLGLLEYQPDSCAIKHSIRPNFIKFGGPTLITCKVMRPDFRSRCSWGESVVKGIAVTFHGPTIDKCSEGNCRESVVTFHGPTIDVHYPMVKLNLAHVESLGQGKLVPISSSWPKGLAAELCHLGCHMGWVSVWAQP